MKDECTPFHKKGELIGQIRWKPAKAIQALSGFEKTFDLTT